MTVPGVTVERRIARRLITLALMRAVALSIALFALYYSLPFERVAKAPTWLVLTVGLAILLAVSGWHLRGIVSAKYPTVRGIEALATTVPLFLILFAAAYFVMARGTPGSFSDQLTRTDALYFTVTVFATVGFGDIAAVSQPARLVVTVQMVLDLLLLGLGVRVFVSAVQRGRQRGQLDSADTADPPGQL